MKIQTVTIMKSFLLSFLFLMMLLTNGAKVEAALANCSFSGNVGSWGSCTANNINVNIASGNTTSVSNITSGYTGYVTYLCTDGGWSVQSSACTQLVANTNCAGTWSAYDACTASCGGGTQSKTFTVTTAQSGTGTACPASPSSQACNTQACYVAPVCTQVTGTNVVSCNQDLTQYGVPLNYTVGTATYTYDSCTYAVTYTGGCSAPAPTSPVLTVAITPFNPSTVTVGQMSRISFNISSYGADWQSTICSAAGTAAVNWGPSLGQLNVSGIDGAYIIPNTAGTYTQSITCTDSTGSATSPTQILVVNPLAYTLSFDTGGGTPATIASITGPVGMTISWPADPTRTGYKYIGWSPFGPQSLPTMPAQDVSVITVWSANSYGITYTATHGSVTPTSCYYGTTVTPVCTPNSGYYTVSCPAAFTCSTSNSKTATFAAVPTWSTAPVCNPATPICSDAAYTTYATCSTGTNSDCSGAQPTRSCAAGAACTVPTWSTAPVCSPSTPTCGSAAYTTYSTCSTGTNSDCTGTQSTRSCAAGAVCAVPIWSTAPTCSPATPSCGSAAYTTYATCSTGTNSDCTGTQPTRSCAAGAVCASGDSCGSANGTPQLSSDPSGSAACSVGAYANSPADTTTSGSQAWNWSCGSASCSSPKYGCNITTDSNYSLPQYGASGPNNDWGCASTCANGATNYSTCNVFATCTTPWGSTIADGVSVPAFKYATVISPSVCTGSGLSETQLCSGGSLSGSYTNQNCVVLVPSIDSFSVKPTRVPFNGALVISWSTTNVTSCSVTKNGSAKWSGTSSPGTSDTVTTQTTYILTCDSLPAKSVRVNVAPNYQEY